MIKIYDSGFRGDCPSELVEQINCAGWLEVNHPDRWPLIFHYPAEAKAKPQYMATRRKAGVRPGVSDILDFGEIRGAFELKRTDKSKTKVSRSQMDFLSIVDSTGGFAAICYGFSQFKLAYSDYRVYCASIAATKAVN